MNIIIRTDASIEIGTGHVMRCLTLAKQLKRHGMEVTFICREVEGNSISYLEKEGFNVISLPITTENLSWHVDVKDTIQAIDQIVAPVDLIIVDHYDLDYHWEKEIRQYTRYIMVIDDLANRQHDCDLLLDQNYYLNMEERYKGLVPTHCIQMLGPNYVLLRDEFLSGIEKTRERTGEVKNILIFFGGTDPTGETIKVLNAIKEISLPNVKINVVVGHSNPNKLVVEQICKEIPNAHFYCQINNMAELMNEADLAIGAGGSAVWERCYVSLPSIVMITAKNQQEVTNAVSGSGALYNLGEASLINKKEIQLAVKSLINDSDKMLNMIRNSYHILNKSQYLEYPVVKDVIKIIK